MKRILTIVIAFILIFGEFMIIKNGYLKSLSEIQYNERWYGEIVEIKKLDYALTITLEDKTAKEYKDGLLVSIKSADECKVFLVSEDVVDANKTIESLNEEAIGLNACALTFYYRDENFDGSVYPTISLWIINE